jgi:eukaryotic-like serine/threonine-protein kinase
MASKVGHYELLAEFACGGMASVHFGRVVGPGGFAKTVAIKRLRPVYARDPEFVRMLLTEARLTGLLDHPNIVSTLDVVATEDDVFVVMEYVRGQSLSKIHGVLRSRSERTPPGIAAAIVSGVLHGLHAAHTAVDAYGRHLEIVHRDVSPQNILVGTDGVARIADFGVAQSSSPSNVPADELAIFGKLAYMAPEVLRGRPATPRSDVYAMGIVLWETLTGERLYTGATQDDLRNAALTYSPPPPSRFTPDVPPSLDDVTLRALERDPTRRFESAGEMARALETALPMPLQSEVSRWAEPLLKSDLVARADLLAHTATTEPLKTFEPTRRTPAKTRRRRFLVVGGILLSTAALGIAALAFRARSGARTHASTSTALAESDVAAASPSSVPVAIGTATVSGSRESDDAPPSARSTARRPPARRPVPVAPRPSIDCTKGYTVDSAGHIIFKKECF